MTLKQGLYLHRGKPRKFQSLVYSNQSFRRIDDEGTGHNRITWLGFKDTWVRVTDLPLGMWDED